VHPSTQLLVHDDPDYGSFQQPMILSTFAALFRQVYKLFWWLSWKFGKHLVYSDYGKNFLLNSKKSTRFWKFLKLVRFKMTREIIEKKWNCKELFLNYFQNFSVLIMLWSGDLSFAFYFNNDTFSLYSKLRTNHFDEEKETYSLKKSKLAIGTSMISLIMAIISFRWWSVAPGRNRIW
jgi:hypothetical protein